MKDICVIYRTDRIGDFICSIPAIYAVRAMLPNHHIVLVTGQAIASLASLLSCINEFHIYEEENPFPYTEIDYCVVLNKQSDRFYTHAKEIHIQHKYGVWNNTSLYEKWKQFSFKERTETQKMLDYVRGINSSLDINAVASFLPEKPLIPSSKIQQRAEQILAPYKNEGRQVIVLSPIKEGSSKVVANEFYPTILQTLHETFPQYSILVIVSDFDKAKGEEIINALPSGLERIHLFINDDLPTLVALIEACDIFIGSSSGPTHIAGLFNKKTIAFYPHNKGHSPQRWGIQGNKVHYILAEKRVDELPLHHPRRFGHKHVKELCQYIQNIDTTPI